MNKIFKVVYNKATGRYEVVSELAKAEGKASSQHCRINLYFPNKCPD